MTHHHAGVIIKDSAQDRLDGAVVGADLGAVHEVADPEVIDIVHLKSFAHIGALFDREPTLSLKDPEQGIVVNGGLAQEILISKIFIELLNGERGIGFAFDLDDFEGLLIEASRSSPIGSASGFEGVKASLAVFSEPGFHGGDRDFAQAIAGKVVFSFGLLAEVVILSSCRLGEHGGDDLEAFESDFFSDVFFHGRFSPLHDLR